MRYIIIAIFALFVTCGVSNAATQFDFLMSQVRTSSQGALVGGKVYFYSAGTTTPKAVYNDRNGTSSAANPFTLDANATAMLYGTGTYRVVIKDSAGVTRYDRDNVAMAGDDGVLTALSTSGGNQTVYLPASGSMIYVKTTADANTVTILPSVVGQTINGLSSYTLYLGGETVTLSLSGTVWYVR